MVDDGKKAESRRLVAGLLANADLHQWEAVVSYFAPWLCENDPDFLLRLIVERVGAANFLPTFQRLGLRIVMA